MALFTFGKPENAFGSKYIVGKLVVEELLKLFEGKGAIALKGNRHTSIILEMLGGRGDP